MTICQDAAKRHEGKSVLIFLTNGVKLSGILAEANEAAIWLVREGQGQTIYYHAMATIAPPHFD